MNRRILLIGAGDRGSVYSNVLRSIKGGPVLVGAADPDPLRLDALKKKHGLSGENCFADWRDLYESKIECDGVIIATPDLMHTEPAAAWLNRGVHVLLEKPMALDKEEVLDLSRKASEAEEKGGSLTVCHVLRYSPLFRKVKEIIDSRQIGDIQSIFHAENVSYYHIAHSYVRGNWSNSTTSSPIILAKCSHDLDLINWFAGSRPVSLCSMSSRSVFIEKNAPSGAPLRCSEGCPAADRCLYEAESTYLRGVHMKKALAGIPGWKGAAGLLLAYHPRISRFIPGLWNYRIWKEWPTSSITGNLTEEGIRNELERGPYGRCVYRCSNDQPEHQDTIISFSSGLTAILRLNGQSHEEGRTLRIDGTLGTIKAKFGIRSEIKVNLHGMKRSHTFRIKTDPLGHGDADAELIRDWINVLDGSRSRSSASLSVMSHLMAFAAHESDRTGKTVQL